MFLFSLGRCLNASSFIVYWLFFCSWWCFNALDAERATAAACGPDLSQSSLYPLSFVMFLSVDQCGRSLNTVESVNVGAAWLESLTTQNTKTWITVSHKTYKQKWEIISDTFECLHFCTDLTLNLTQSSSNTQSDWAALTARHSSLCEINTKAHTVSLKRTYNYYTQWHISLAPERTFRQNYIKWTQKRLNFTRSATVPLMSRQQSDNLVIASCKHYINGVKCRDITESASDGRPLGGGIVL